MTRGRGPACVSVVLLPLGLAGCSRHASVPECSALLDRYVELLVKERDPQASDDEMTKQKQGTRAKAATDPSFAACPGEVTKDGVACAMAAPNVDEFEKCLE
jgi:hypothetical protein